MASHLPLSYSGNVHRVGPPQPFALTEVWQITDHVILVMWLVGLYDQLPQIGHVAFSKALKAGLVQAMPTTKCVNPQKVKMITFLYAAGHIMQEDHGGWYTQQ